MTTAVDPNAPLGISDVAEVTGLSQDTLRWYEREGLIPSVDRGSDRRRRYDVATVRMIHLLVRLRRTGMPVADMRAFVEMLAEGAASHGRRLTLLQRHRDRVLGQMARLEDDLGALDDKIGHYHRLIAAGLDCAERPVTDPRTLDAQRSTT